MSLITSAKCAKFRFTPSYIALVVALAVFLMLIWAVIVIPIPAIASVWLCFFLLSRPINALVPTPLQGDVEINYSGSISLHGQRFYFSSVNALYSFLCISFEGKHQHLLLWRDSCDDQTYRQLLVKLKQER